MERFFRSIHFIEENIYQPISIHDIAAASHFSAYHFSRVFKALTGDTPKEYLRKRRLTIAADRLVKTDDAILDLALDCQFDSQEAFTRAFKQLFNVTPGQFRKAGDPYRLLYKDQFSPHMLHHLQENLTMEPSIIERGETKVVGVAAQYTEEHLDYSTLWSAFRPYVQGNIPNRTGEHFFGLFEEYAEDDDQMGFTYICSVEVENFDNVPEGLIARTLDKQLYAVFEHHGTVSSLPETLKYIWGSWLPKSKYEYIEKPDFEIYPRKAEPGNPPDHIFLHIPIREAT